MIAAGKLAEEVKDMEERAWKKWNGDFSEDTCLMEQEAWLDGSDEYGENEDEDRRVFGTDDLRREGVHASSAARTFQRIVSTTASQPIQIQTSPSRNRGLSNRKIGTQSRVEKAEQEPIEGREAYS